MATDMIANMPKTDDAEELRFLQGVSRRFLEARQRRGLAVSDLDAMAGVPRGTSSRIQTGARPRITPYTLVRLARALNVSPAWLLTGEEEPARSEQSADQRPSRSKRSSR